MSRIPARWLFDFSTQIIFDFLFLKILEFFIFFNVSLSFRFSSVPRQLVETRNKRDAELRDEIM
jgi:hypothetical protein